MFFEITVHFFNLHSASATPQSHLQVGQIGSQTPGFLFADLPMHQQIDWINLLDCQITFAQSDTLTGLLDTAPKGLPTAIFNPDACVSFLAQN